MSYFAQKFRDSALELRRLPNLCIAAMLVGLSVVLGLFQIPLMSTIYIRFGFIALGMIGWLYGPVAGGLCAGISDVLCTLLVPTNNSGYFWGFTVSAVLTGMIYGAVMYQHKISPLRVLLAMLLTGIFVNILLNTYWLTIMYGDGYFAILPARVLKNAATIVLNSIVFFIVSSPLSVACRKLGLVR